jgi:hypothetical protein
VQPDVIDTSNEISYPQEINLQKIINTDFNVQSESWFKLSSFLLVANYFRIIFVVATYGHDMYEYVTLIIMSSAVLADPVHLQSDPDPTK